MIFISIVSYIDTCCLYNMNATWAFLKFLPREVRQLQRAGQLFIQKKTIYVEFSCEYSETPLYTINSF